MMMVLIVLSTVNTSLCTAQDRMRGPVQKIPEHPNEVYGSGDNLFFDIYQRWISPIKGGNQCPMYPSCSQYAKIAFHDLPWPVAYVKSFERVLRCGRELYLYPTVRIDGMTRWYDPVKTEDDGGQNE